MPKQNVEQEKKKPVNAKFDVKQVRQTKAHVIVTIGEDIISERYRDQVANIIENVPVKGYRIGKAPEALVRRLFKKELEGFVLKDVISAAIDECIEKKPCKFISPLDIVEKDKLEVKEGKPFQFTLEGDVMPEIELKKYKGFELELPPDKVTKTNLSRVERHILDNVAEFIPSNEFKSEQWETVNDIQLSIEGEGKPITGTNIPLTDEVDYLSISKEIIPIPTDKLVRLKKGDTLIFKHKFDSSTPVEGLKNKTATIELRIKSIKNKIYPKITEDLVKSLNYKDMAAFKEEVRAKARQAKQTLISSLKYQQLYRNLLDENHVELPDTVLNWIIEKETGMPLKDESNNIYDFAKHLSPDARERFENAEAALDFKIKLILNKIAEAENIAVSDDEISKVIGEYAAKEGITGDELKKALTETGQLAGFKEMILHNKVQEFILSTCTVKEVKENE